MPGRRKGPVVRPNSKYGPIWRTDLSPEEVVEALEALEEMRAFCHGSAAAVRVYLDGEGRLNPKAMAKALQEKNKRLAELIQKFAVGYGESATAPAKVPHSHLYEAQCPVCTPAHMEK